MKRTMSAVLMVALLLGLLSGIALAEDAKERALKIEEEYLAAYEQMEAVNSWAMRYVDDYFADPTFANLVRAIASVTSAKSAFEFTVPPEAELQSDDLNELFLEGADVVWMSLSKENFAETRDYFLYKYMNLSDTMLDDAVYLPFHKAIVEKLEDDKASEKCSRLTVCQEANYLLLQIGNAEKWDQYTAAYPCLFEDHPAFDSDADHLYQETEKLLSEIEEYTLKGDRWIALLEYRFDKMEEAQNDDVDSPLEEILAPRDALDRVYLQPVWYCISDYSYSALYMDDEGHLAGHVKAGDDLSQAPNAMMMKMPNVTREELVEYVATLQEYGFEAAAKDTEDEYICGIGYDSCPLYLTWKQDEGATMTFLHGMGCMIPEWMLYV